MSRPAIICVDDEKFVLSSLKAELKQFFGEEYQIETAEGGLEALDILRELLDENNDVPVIIADYIMPDIKGDDLLEQVHGISPKTLKVMLTGQAGPDAVGNAVNKARLYRYIAKPWDPDDLGMTIQEAVKSYFQDKQLDEQNRQLKEMNQTLEIRVTERTRELSNALEELKNMQTQLVHAEKMAAIGNLVAGIAHEVNNPIGVVKSSADIQERCIARIHDLVDKGNLDTNEKQQEYQKNINILRSNNQIIAQASDRISRLVKNLKNFTRLDEEELQAINIQDSIDNTIEIIEPELDGIEIIKKYEKLPLVPCYVNLINQVFLSLLMFCIQDMNGKGTITIETGLERKTDLTGVHQYAEIRITDTGKGLTRDQLDNLFELGFWTKDARVQLRTELSIAYNIIQKHNGRIHATSTPGQGTSFNLSLPLVPFTEL